MLTRSSDISEDWPQELNVRGVINVQLAVKDNEVYVLEVNPRAISDTCPSSARPSGVPLDRRSPRRSMLGIAALDEQGCDGDDPDRRTSRSRKPVFPFGPFPEVDLTLGPEMRSTGEVMGVDADFGRAFAKAQLAAGNPLPTEGLVFVSVHNRDKPTAARIARRLHTLGFRLCATGGTADAIAKLNVPCERIRKLSEGSPNVLDLLAREVDPVVLMINTPLGKESKIDDVRIRRAAIQHGVPYTTTLSAAGAAVAGIEATRRTELAPVRLTAVSPRDLHVRTR
jgi:carbamoyl-phosphate synthase large subunit